MKGGHYKCFIMELQHGGKKKYGKGKKTNCLVKW
jgi:hypothetical protein